MGGFLIKLLKLETGCNAIYVFVSLNGQNLQIASRFLILSQVTFINSPGSYGTDTWRMRSSVSVILSDPVPDTTMAFPDYDQTCADHARYAMV